MSLKIENPGIEAFAPTRDFRAFSDVHEQWCIQKGDDLTGGHDHFASFLCFKRKRTLALIAFILVLSIFVARFPEDVAAHYTFIFLQALAVLTFYLTARNWHRMKCGKQNNRKRYKFRPWQDYKKQKMPLAEFYARAYTRIEDGGTMKHAMQSDAVNIGTAFMALDPVKGNKVLLAMGVRSWAQIQSNAAEELLARTIERLW